MKKINTHLMPRIKRTLSALVLPALVLLMYTPGAYAQNYDPSSSVFRFHQKMAKRGVAASQQKLGLMYETGSGTRQSTVSARLWYKRAAAQNYKPAINRLTYLQIKRSGYTNEHNKWLKNLKNDARFNNGEALFLLGQMYSEGTGVNKSLTKSLELLQKAAAGDIPGSEAQITRVEEELSILQKRHARQKKTTPAKLKPLKAASTRKPSAKPAVIASGAKITRAKTTRKIVPATYSIPAKTSQTAQQKTTAKPRSKQDKDINKTGTTAASKPARHRTLASPATKKPEQSHPMDAICGGKNRFSRGCRQY